MLADELSKVQCPTDFSSRFWCVEFQNVLIELAVKFRDWGASEMELSAFSKTNMHKFTSGLRAFGIEIDEDPQAKAQKNRSLFRSVQSRLEQTSLAWLLKQKMDPAQWRNKFEALPEIMASEVENSGFLTVWKSEIIFTLIKDFLTKDQSVDALISIIMACATLEDFEQRLGLTQDELSKAQIQLEEQKEQEKKRRRQIPVCGHPFDPEEDNLTNLMKHISENITDDNLESSLFNLESQVALSKTKTCANPEGNRAGSRAGRTRGSKETADDKLVGLAGEIHVFRILEKKYGKQAIHSGCWKSKNSQKVFDDNPSDDDLGYDFCFKLNGKTHHIEVKASRGDDCSFRLGTSEVRIARKLAAKKNKADIFQIIHVHNALLTTPSFHVLPNPFEDRYRDKFELSDAEVWVRYREKKGD